MPVDCFGLLLTLNELIWRFCTEGKEKLGFSKEAAVKVTTEEDGTEFKRERKRSSEFSQVFSHLPKNAAWQRNMSRCGGSISNRMQSTRQGGLKKPKPHG